jgi:hypothetical protein
MQKINPAPQRVRRAALLVISIAALLLPLAGQNIAADAASVPVPAGNPAAPAPGAGTTPLTAVRAGSAQAQVMQRRVEADLASRQAAAIAPRGSRGEAGAIPVVQAMQGRAASSLTVPVQPEMVTAAAPGRAGAAQVTGSASTVRQLAAAAPGTADTGLDAMWNNYGNSAGCADWSGGDATNGVNLGGGTVAWFFSDTYLGSPVARKNLFGVSHLRNSIVIQQGSSLRTITGGNTCEETNTGKSFWDRYAKTPAAAPDASSGGFYWTGDQMVVGSNVVKFYYHGNRSKFPFAIDGSAVATIPVSALESDTAMPITPTPFTSLCPSVGTNTIIWGSALLSWQGNVYVYGWSTTSKTLLYLARTTPANLTDTTTWQTFAGLNNSGQPIWSACGTGITPLPITLGSGISVSTIPGSSSLWLVQEDKGKGLVNGPITAHPASAPWLFNNKEVVLYYPPQENHSYPYYYLTYEPRLQPALAYTNQVVISYNVNTTAIDTGCVTANVHDASIYRPRFIDVPTSAFSTASLTDAAVGSGTDLPAPSYGIQDAGPADPAAAPAINAAGTVLDSAAGTGPSIDGATDWYDQWGSLAGGCPAYTAPATLTVSPSTPAGEATLTWPTVGTDVWYWGYQADQTAGTAFAKTWGGLWAEATSTTAKTVSDLVAPVTSGQTNGDIYAWYIQPFGAGGTFIGPTGISPTAAEAITIQKPDPPGLVTGGHGTGAESEFSLNWADVTYPSSAVYYWIYFWDISANQTEQQALGTQPQPSCGNAGITCPGQLPDPIGPGAHSYDIQGWTPDNNVILTPDNQYGFVIEAENLAGYSNPSIAVSVMPTPVCYSETIPADSGGDLTFQGGPNVYLYLAMLGFPQPLVGDVIGIKDQATGIQHNASLLGTPAVEVLWFQEGADPPISWDLAYELAADNDVYTTITSSSC